MKICRTAVRAAVSLLLVGAGLAASASASAAAPRSTATVNAVSTVPAEIAVRGFNNHLYARGNAQPSFHDLGGRIISTPAVGYSSTTGRLYFVAVGTDHALWVRTDYAPWSRLVGGHTACNYSPALTVLGNSFVVACTGLHSRQTFVGATNTLPSDGNVPQILQVQNQQGESDGSPTLSRSGSGTYLWIIGQPHAGYNMYLRRLNEPAGTYQAEGYGCHGQAGVAGIAGDNLYLGCQNFTPDALRNRLNYYVGSQRGLDGTMRGPVGVARAFDGSHATFFVTDLNGAVWMKDVSPSGVDTFVKLGGDVQRGVGAVVV